MASVYETIDGRKVIAAHGTREMPIWGAYDRGSLYPRDKIMDPSYDPEAVVRNSHPRYYRLPKSIFRKSNTCGDNFCNAQGVMRGHEIVMHKMQGV